MSPEEIAAIVTLTVKAAVSMSPEEVLGAAGMVVAFTQLIKWVGLPDTRGPLAVIGFSALLVVLHAVSRDDPFTRKLLYSYASCWIAISTSAAGVFGFTRSGAAAVTATKTPPAAPGAGANETVKPIEETKSEEAFRKAV